MEVHRHELFTVRCSFHAVVLTHLHNSGSTLESPVELLEPTQALSLQSQSNRTSRASRGNPSFTSASGGYNVYQD